MKKPSTAEQLVRLLGTRGYTVLGVSYEIVRHHGQARMNTAAGECAPTWELRANPLWNTITHKIVAHGTAPQVRMPNGAIRTMLICSHIPLRHILAQPAKEWTIYEDSVGRLVIETKNLPETWLR
jgi:hypothetical protein